MTDFTPITGLSICVPALNEEEGLKSTIFKLQDCLQRVGVEHEIIIVNDGSIDATGDIADLLASKNKNINVIHHAASQGRGAAFRDVLRHASFSHYMLLNGKNDIYVDELNRLLGLWVKHPSKLIISWQKNTEEREWLRRNLSYAFTWVNNQIFSQSIHYYNNPTIFPVKALRQVQLKNDSYAFQAEAIIKLLKMGQQYVEIGVVDRLEENRKTRGLTFKNLAGILSHFVVTWKDTRRQNV